MARLSEVVEYLDGLLHTADVPDYEGALNGLQLANRGDVTRVAAAVDFSVDAVRKAVEARASLLLVHHGMFWRGAHRFVGVAHDRLRSAIEGDLAVYSSHIPLDLHPTFGNNTLLAAELTLSPEGTFGRFRGVEIGVSGQSDIATSELVVRLQTFASTFQTTVVTTPIARDQRTRRWAIVTGAGASPATLGEATERGIDTLIVGEGTHHTAVDAREMGLVVMYAGHYATETLGVRALATHLAERFDLSDTFLSLPTGL